MGALVFWSGQDRMAAYNSTLVAHSEHHEDEFDGWAG
jgi:hypothetical protein